MRSFRIYVSAAVLICVLIITFSCTPGMCFEETNAFLEASFYLESTGKAKAPDSLTLIGLGKDTARYNKVGGIQPALIPLNTSAENCSFMIKINGVSDTISFLYNSWLHMISKECGYTYYHSLDTVYSTRNIIDTILIKQKTITNLNDQNIQIYY
jgi:predicted nucleic-acid-binding Zn-ribbon protein